MSALRRIFRFFRPSRKVELQFAVRYGAEVLYSGWVDLPRFK